ncbi:hypothetical protein HDV04_006317 [Boothiomyces sp. JEL0838]|nr:hypothetical protein HDV04_006317 [Boothiomyces sp. JEL0838]
MLISQLYYHPLGLQDILATSKKSPKLKGGAQISPLTPFIWQAKKQIRKIAKESPITFIQIGLGITIHLISLTTLISPTKLLFHSKLLENPVNSYRVLTSFLVLGTTLFDVGKRSLSLFYTQAPLEAMFDQPLKPPGRYPDEEDDEKFVLGKPNFRFLTMQLMMMGMIVSIETLVFPNFNLTKKGGIIKVFPYTLYPILEHAIQWMWAMCTDERQTVAIAGFIRLEPVLVPLAMWALSGFDNGVSLLKGLAVAVSVGQVLQIKRWNGEDAVSWFAYISKSWYKWTRKQIDIMQSK